jgi:hypothetical protein
MDESKNQDFNIVPSEPQDHDTIVALFKQYKFALQEKEWLTWKYFNNPYQKGLSFKIVKEGKIVGAVALLPRTYYFQGRQVTGIQAVDGLMGKEIRGKGLFNDVMGFLLQNKPPGVTDKSFYISFPSRADSVKAHENAGWYRLADFLLYSFFLNVNVLRKIKWIKWIVPVLNMLYQTYIWIKIKNDGEMQIQEVDRFNIGLNSRFSGDKVFGDREAEFLNWRIIDNPQDKIKAFFIVREQEQVGYIACKANTRNFEIIDIKLKEARKHIIHAFLKYLVSNNLADSVDFAILDNHNYIPLIRKAGFVNRKAQGALFVHDFEKVGLPNDPKYWEINYIDSDW